MRIIAGKNKGIKLDTLPGDNTRPTLDRVKESVFSIIDTIVSVNDLEINNCLDLFSGSGALGIELVSRYNCNAMLIDNSKEAIEIINKNVLKTKNEELIKVKNLDYNVFLEQNNKDNNTQYDIIFLDPPYSMNVIDIIDKIVNYNMLSEYGIIVYETDNINSINEIKNKYTNREETRLEVIKEKKYSRVHILFLI